MPHLASHAGGHGRHQRPSSEVLRRHVQPKAGFRQDWAQLLFRFRKSGNQSKLVPPATSLRICASKNVRCLSPSRWQAR